MAIVTALMSTFNSANYVEDAIASVLEQSFEDFELLIIDDASVDDTVAKIKGFNDSRIRLIEQPCNQGIGATLSFGLTQVHSPYIAKIDSDDICHPERFARQHQFMQQHPELDIVKCLFEYFPDNEAVALSKRYSAYKSEKESAINSVQAAEQIQQEILRWNCIIHSTYFAKTEVIKNLDYPQFRVGEDYSLFFRAAQQGYRIGCVPENLLFMRVSETSVTAQSSVASEFTQALYAIKESHILQMVRRHQQLFIYGAGEFAKAFAAELIKRQLPLNGFVDRLEQSPIQIGSHSFPVFSISQHKGKGVVIAAQPVRHEIATIFSDAGWSEWQDFMILA